MLSSLVWCPSRTNFGRSLNRSATTLMFDPITYFQLKQCSENSMPTEMESKLVQKKTHNSKVLLCRFLIINDDDDQAECRGVQWSAA